MKAIRAKVFTKKLPQKFYEEHAPLILLTIEESELAHRGQLRWDKSLYILHSFAVCLILTNEFHFLDIYTFLAGLKHDGPEDKKTQKGEDDEQEKIRQNQGVEPASIVRAVTKPRNEKERYLWFVRLLLSCDFRAYILKFADRIHNLRTLANLPKAKRRKKLAETKLYFPILRDALVVLVAEAINKGDLHPSYSGLPTLCFEILEKEILKLEALKNF